ncbi:MAG: DUF1804 family protein [Pseudomonadales bacterium]
MAYSEETKRNVRAAYIYNSHSLKAAAAANEVPYETARSWKRKAEGSGDDWDNARAAARISQGGIKALTTEIIEEFALLFQATIEQVKNADVKPLEKAEAISRLSDAYSKTVKAAGASNPELSRLSVAMDVLRLLAEFIKSEHPKHLDAFLDILEPFGEVVSREFG